MTASVQTVLLCSWLSRTFEGSFPHVEARFVWIVASSIGNTGACLHCPYLHCPLHYAQVTESSSSCQLNSCIQRRPSGLYTARNRMGVPSATALLLCAAAMLCAAPFRSQARLDWADMTSQIHLQNGDVSTSCTACLTTSIGHISYAAARHL